MQPFVLIPAQGSDHADEWHRLGLEAHVAGNLHQAQKFYQSVLRLNPRHALSTQNLAVAIAGLGNLNEALLTIERAMLLDSTQSIIWVNAALLHLEADRIEDALRMAREGLAMEETVPTLMALAMVLATAGYPEEAVPLYEKILAVEPNHISAGVNVCFVQTLTNATPPDLLRTRRLWWQHNHHPGPVQPHRNDRSPDRPLRVGYVGGDFKCHSAAFIFSRAVLHHSADVELYLYSSLPVNPAADGRTKQFVEAAGPRWRDIHNVSDEDAAQLIRKDGIDILVDLAGHTNGGRLALFTRKPAPIQVTAWGFAHGSGLAEMDYFFADPVAVPEHERANYTEKIYDLPCIVTMEPPLEYQISGVSQAPYRRNDYVTFGSYARHEKMNDECLKVFAEILRRVPDSRLQFKDHAYRRPYCMRRIVGLMPDIAPERLLFSLATSHPDHLLAIQQADIVLDTFPHGGGVVTLETLFMGVPMITLYGGQPSGRTASSVLSCMGRTDWIARTTEEYIQKAVALAEDTKTLAAVRKTLRQELLDSAVVKDYHLRVEEAYRGMWRIYCAQA